MPASNPPKRSQPTPHQGLDVRERILAVADEHFYVQGYGQTGVNQIIKDAAVAKASFYNHFPAKEDLAEAYLRARHQQWFESFDVALKTASTPRDRVIAPFLMLERWLPSVNFRGCAFINFMGERALPERLKACVQEHKRSLLLVLEGVVADYVADTVLSLSAQHLVLLFEGAIVQAQIFQNDAPLKAATSACLSLLEDNRGRSQKVRKKVS